MCIAWFYMCMWVLMHLLEHACGGPWLCICVYAWFYMCVQVLMHLLECAYVCVCMLTHLFGHAWEVDGCCWESSSFTFPPLSDSLEQIQGLLIWLVLAVSLF